MRRVVAPALLGLALLSGCARDDVLQVTGDYVSLRVRDYRYDHQDVRVRPGRILFGVTNEGPDPTNFRVRQGDRDVLDITTMQPGEHGVGSATLAPGTYVMYSSVGRNETLGEHGTLTVSRRIATPPPAQRTAAPQGLTQP